MDPAQTWRVAGLGGQALDCVLGDVKLEVTDGTHAFRWPAKIGFVDFLHPRDEVIVVGHAGCLDLFRIVYDGPDGSLEMIVTPSFTGQVR